MSKLNLNSLTYSETRSINFGDYESRQFFLSLGCELTKQGIEIREGASIKSEPMPVSFEEGIKILADKVGSHLDKKEYLIRKHVVDCGYPVPDDESFERKLLEVKKRVQERKVKKEMKKVKE